MNLYFLSRLASPGYLHLAGSTLPVTCVYMFVYIVRRRVFYGL